MIWFWLLALSFHCCYFGSQCLADALILLLEVGDQLRRLFDGSVLADSL
jgi:hypothetical protein